MSGLRAAVSTGLVLAALIGAAMLLPGPAMAQTNPVSELKIGGLAHDVGLFDHHVERGADVNVELLFNSPDLLRYIGSPPPPFGARLNTPRQTRDGAFWVTLGDN